MNEPAVAAEADYVLCPTANGHLAVNFSQNAQANLPYPLEELAAVLALQLANEPVELHVRTAQLLLHWADGRAVRPTELALVRSGLETLESLVRDMSAMRFGSWQVRWIDRWRRRAHVTLARTPLHGKPKLTRVLMADQLADHPVAVEATDELLTLTFEPEASLRSWHAGIVRGLDRATGWLSGCAEAYWQLASSWQTDCSYQEHLAVLPRQGVRSR